VISVGLLCRSKILGFMALTGTKSTENSKTEDFILNYSLGLLRGNGSMYG
jgi:hypothetical protein